MGMQKFWTPLRPTIKWPNGAVGYAPGGMMDCIGPFAKVKNCPVDAHPGVRVTAFATDYADTWFSVPAVCSWKGKPVHGFFKMEDGSPEFHVYDKSKHLFAIDWADGGYPT